MILVISEPRSDAMSSRDTWVFRLPTLLPIFLVVAPVYYIIILGTYVDLVPVVRYLNVLEICRVCNGAFLLRLGQVFTMYP